MEDWRRWQTVWRTMLLLGITGAVLCLAIANLVARANWQEVEDGVLWVARADGLAAAEVLPLGPGARAGMKAGDLLIAIDGRPVEAPGDVLDALHQGSPGTQLTYTVLRQGEQQALGLTLTPVPQGNRSLYYILAMVGIFSLLVGLSVRLRRSDDQATLHFFWLCVAFFGVFAFSFSGRLDRFDWVFYWADTISILLLPPLFLHFCLVFPERPHAWLRGPAGRAGVPLMYLPGLLLGAARIIAVVKLSGDARFGTVVETLDRLELIYLGVCLVTGLTVLLRALGRVHSVTPRRQLRWIVWGTAVGALPFVVGYVLPYCLGITPWRRMEFTAIPLGLVPLAFASAIVRYRLMDVEVIIKRLVVYAAVVCAIAAMYAILLRVSALLFLSGSERYNTVLAVLATLVVVLLARPLKNVIQTTLDRAYYRDRYDYRRALVGFARDLNSDLDLSRLTERLVSRVMETFLVDRMALMLAPLADDRGGDFSAIRAEGFEPEEPPSLPHTSAIAARLLTGSTIMLDDLFMARRFPAEEVEMWRDRGIHCFVPCVSKEGTIAVMALGRRESGELLNSEDLHLLMAVAGQVATALENGRFNRRLRLKADELDGMRQFSENILESLNDGLAVLDLDDRVMRWNGGLERLYGISWEAAIGRGFSELFDADFSTVLASARRQSADCATLYRMPLRSRHPDEPRRLLVNAAISPLQTPAGETAGTIVILEDITSRVQLEEQLQISEKMASIGLLAAGVAHEVNTPLTGISSFTQMLLQSADPEDPRTRLLEKIERQTFRAAKIVNGLLNLSRPSQVDSGPVDVNCVINDVLSLLEHQFRNANIQVRKELSPAFPFVQGMEHKLQQVFLNLFLNARDAMPKGGWLSISTRVLDDEVVAEVGDTGAGISSEHLSRIYDPFFTTKGIGQGTGLGLSVTYGIVQEHAGSIGCSSTIGQGTRFTLAFPLSSALRDRQAGVAN